MKPILILVLVIGLAGCQTQSSVTPAALPTGVAIVPPGSDVPGQIAAFSGIWRGTWGKDVPVALAIETIEPNGSAIGAYAVGGNGSSLFPSQARKVLAQVMKGRLVVEPLDNGALVSFTLAKDGTLIGKQDLGGVVTAGVLKKQAQAGGTTTSAVAGNNGAPAASGQPARSATAISPLPQPKP